MTAIAENWDLVLSGFRTTLLLTFVSAAAALVLGSVLAAMRVSPVAPLRGLATLYVDVLRNTPLTLVFFFWIFVGPQLLAPEQRAGYPLGIVPGIIALSLYTSAFVCEAIRSGINSVGVGQAEAARSIGLTFGQTLSLVVLPQAVRTVIPPLINVFIALTKNTSVGAGFAITELIAVSRRLANTNPQDVIPMLIGIGLFYLAITIPSGLLAGRVERKVAFAR